MDLQVNLQADLSVDLQILKILDCLQKARIFTQKSGKL